MTTNDPLHESEAPEPPPLVSESVKHDPYAVWRNRNYRRYIIGNGFSLIGQQMAGVTIGWELYNRTHSAALLGLVGLVQVLPILCLSLPAGYIIDHINRKKLILTTTAALVVVYVTMGLASRYSEGLEHVGVLDWGNQLLGWAARLLGAKGVEFTDPYVPILFSLLLLTGTIRAINMPARQTLMPMLVEAKHFPNAVTWNTSLFETSNMVGPMAAGLAIAGLQGWKTGHGSNPWAYAVMYWINAGAQVAQFINFAMIRLPHVVKERQQITLRQRFGEMLAGVRFVYGTKLVLAVMTLDMLAVLLGGATALLPLYAKDILHVGSAGYGWLRAAPSIGAVTMALIVAHLPPMKHAGRNMLLAVAGFGIATIVFGLSTNFWLSIAALVATGLCDNVSVVVRHSLVQLLTPNQMRGRVNAVNSVFISCSNELGAFESGATAQVGIRFLGAIWGPMIAVAGGGVGTILVVLGVAAKWPQINGVGRLADVKPKEPVEAGRFPVDVKSDAG